MQLSLLTLIAFLATAIFAAPIPNPQKQVIGTPCIGSPELGCGVFRGSKREAIPGIAAEIANER